MYSKDIVYSIWRHMVVKVSYHTFLELFKYKIIYYIMDIEGMNLAKAYALWKEATIYNERVHEIMTYIIENPDEGIRVLINRNPTLNFYSMLLMKIRSIKPDGKDYCLSVPLSILTGLNADWMSRSGSEYMVTCIEKLCERLTSGVSFLAC